MRLIKSKCRRRTALWLILMSMFVKESQQFAVLSQPETEQTPGTETGKQFEYRFEWYCDLQKSPLVTLEWEDGSYVLANQTERKLVQMGGHSAGPLRQLANNVSSNELTQLEPPLEISARHCSCWTTAASMNDENSTELYCPMTMTHCAMSSYPDYKRWCVRVNARVDFSRSIWPMLVLSYIFLLLYLNLTVPGRNVLACFFSFCMPLNAWQVDRMDHYQGNQLILSHFRFVRERRIRRLMRRREHLIRTGRAAENDTTPNMMELELDPRLIIRNTPQDAQTSSSPNYGLDELQPTSLQLKTRIFRASDESQSEETAVPDCTICYAPIQDGDRVGVLPTCEHIFHVDCLKLWCTRRNVCPLCLSEDIATPQFVIPGNANNHEEVQGDEDNSQHDESENDNTTEVQQEENSNGRRFFRPWR